VKALYIAKTDTKTLLIEVLLTPYSETENEYGETELKLECDATARKTGKAYFYWFSSPGYEKSEPIGPFETEEEAYRDALNQFGV
jgi:hypothetical protein